MATNDTKELWRHKKTGGIYEWIGSGLLESDKTPMTIYRNIDTCMTWIRPVVEFYDGRFERLENIK